jgi:alcohol dehydrogenase
MLRGKCRVDDTGARMNLLHVLGEWTERMRLPRLGEFGVTEAYVAHVVANCRGSSMKTNPVVLSDPEVGEILRARL